MALTQSALDDLWDFGDPALSEARLRAALEAESDASSRAELQTQVARALGLQERFVDADVLLSATASLSPEVSVRIALERGRLRNSAGDPAAALPLFELAAEGAASARLLFLEVDALHMLAIADPGGAAQWTRRAFEVLEGVTDARTLRWAVSLHNNAGWSHFDEGRFAEAVTEFEKARDAAARWGTRQQVQWADEALAEARAAATTPRLG